MHSTPNYPLLISLFLFFSSSILFAQQNNSILYLRNGSIYIGEILNDKGNDLEMRLADGNEVQFSKLNVKRYLDAKKIVVHPNGKYHVINGFFFQTGLGMNLESLVQDEENARISSHTPFLFGYYVNPRWALGGGFAFEFNEAEVSGFEFDTQFISQFIYGRYYLNTRKRRPFAFTRIGYGFRGDESEFNDDHNGGFQFQTGAGIHLASRKKSKFVLSLGYHVQKTDGTERFLDQFGNEIITDYNIWIRRMIISFGIEFNKVKKGYH